MRLLLVGALAALAVALPTGYHRKSSANFEDKLDRDAERMHRGGAREKKRRDGDQPAAAGNRIDEARREGGGDKQEDDIGGEFEHGYGSEFGYSAYAVRRFTMPPSLRHPFAASFRVAPSAPALTVLWSSRICASGDSG